MLGSSSRPTYSQDCAYFFFNLVSVCEYAWGGLHDFNPWLPYNGAMECSDWMLHTLINMLLHAMIPMAISPSNCRHDIEFDWSYWTPTVMPHTSFNKQLGVIKADILIGFPNFLWHLLLATPQAQCSYIIPLLGWIAGLGHLWTGTMLMIIRWSKLEAAPDAPSWQGCPPSY